MIHKKAMIGKKYLRWCPHGCGKCCQYMNAKLGFWCKRCFKYHKRETIKSFQNYEVTSKQVEKNGKEKN